MINSQTPEHQLADEFIREMKARVIQHERVELEMSLDVAFSVLAALQLALRHPEVAGLAECRARHVAVWLEEKLGTTPAAKEVCRRGWLETYDEVFDGRAQ